MAYQSNLRRLVYIASVLTRHGLAHLSGKRLNRLLKKRLPPGDMTGPERVRAILEDIGGTAIKFGQMLALQPDILPFEYCNALYNLLDRVAPFQPEEVHQIILEELGEKPLEIFETFDDTPLATASIAQVHVATLNGVQMAVKVQRPNTETEFGGDIQLMEAAIGLIRSLKSLSWLADMISEFIDWTREELDFRCEARYMAQLRQNARDNPTEQIPRVRQDLTTSRVLVAEFLDGQTVLAHLRTLENGEDIAAYQLRSNGFDPDVFARNIIDNFLFGAFQKGLFHADLHPANLLILSDNVVGYVDFGITGVLSHYARRKVAEMTLAHTRADLDGMCAAFFEISTINPASDVEKFRQGLEAFSKEWYEPRGNRQWLRRNFTLVMLDILKLSRQTGIYPGREVIKYIRSSIAADGLITRFAENFDVGGYLETACDRYLKWHIRQASFSYDSLAAWSNASSSLAKDGPGRAIGVLDRLISGQLPIEIGPTTGADDSTQRYRVISLAAVVLLVSILITTTGTQAQFGINLFTAELMLGAAATAQLFRTLYQWTFHTA
jgi:ubiquinone biosynthesis protein